MNLDLTLRRLPTWVFVVLVPVVALVAVLVTGFGSGDSSASTPSGTAADAVVIKNFAFSPDTITLKAGTTITVVNDDDTTHTFTADGGAFDTGDLRSGQRGRVVVGAAGTYTYHCDIHPFMKGTVRVSP